MPPGRQAEIERLDQKPVAKGFRNVLRLDHQIAEPRARRQDDLCRLGGLLPALRDERLIRRKPGLALCLTRPRALPHPFELAFEGAAARRLLPALLLEPLLLLVEPSRIIALVRDAAAAVELEDPARDLVEEIAVVSDGHDGAGVVFQEALQPGHQLGVEMVGRLVEQQQVGPLQEEPAQRDAAPLAARQIGDLGITGRAAQRVHRNLDGAIEVPGVPPARSFPAVRPARRSRHPSRLPRGSRQSAR